MVTYALKNYPPAEQEALIEAIVTKHGGVLGIRGMYGNLFVYPVADEEYDFRDFGTVGVTVPRCVLDACKDELKKEGFIVRWGPQEDHEYTHVH